MTQPTDHPWEEWQLSAYLLGELEPDMAARIAEAAESDPALAQELKELSSTLDDVRQALAHESTAASDPVILSALQSQVAASVESNLANATPTAAVASASTLPGPFTGKRLWSRWENWASLAGLIAIVVLLVRRETFNSQVALSGPAISSPTKMAESNSDASFIDRELARQIMEGKADAVLLDPQPAGEHPVSEQPTGEQPTGDAHPFQPNEPMVDSLALAASSAPHQAAPTPDSPLGVAGTALTLPAPGAMPADGVGVDSFGADPFGDAKMDLNAVGGGMPMVKGKVGGLPGGMGGSMGGYGGMGGAMGGYGSGEGGGGMGGYGGALGGVGLGQPGAMEGMGGMMGGGGEGSAALGWKADGRPQWYHESEEARYRRQPEPPPSGDRFSAFRDNDFLSVNEQPLSTFSVDVDTASYTKARQYLSEHHQLPPPPSVRIEEFINYFDYQYAGPKDEKPFAAALAVSSCPWQPEHQLVRIALQAKKVEMNERPKANLVFLLDVSGSMADANKLPLVKESIRLLTYQLTENDRVAMVVYAGAAGCVLESTLGNHQDEILAAIGRLNAGGSTNGGQGIQLAYKLARDHFIEGGINRVILCTDGDFNVGVTGTDALVSLVEEQAKSNVFLTVLGFGMGNTNDAMMEQIADRGNGIYGFVDSHQEAQRQMVKQLSGNLMTVAKDVKIQVEFNPAKIKEYRLIGYENRQLKTEDFNNDRKDAGEIGAGHRVTALYEIVPVNAKTKTVAAEDELRYQPKKKPVEPVPAPVDVAVDAAVGNEASRELLAVKLRYKEPEGTESRLLVFPLDDHAAGFEQADQDFRWAASMAEFGMLLRNSPHKGQSSWAGLSERARAAVGSPADLQRSEALELIRIAREQVGR